MIWLLVLFAWTFCALLVGCGVGLFIRQGEGDLADEDKADETRLDVWA